MKQALFKTTGNPVANMNLYYILDENGDPVPKSNPLEFDKWFEDIDNRRLAFDTVAEGVDVSTVFLGIDHNFSMEGPPVLFETLVFGGKYDQYMQRYTNKAEALAGHDQTVAMVSRFI